MRFLLAALIALLPSPPAPGPVALAHRAVSANAQAQHAFDEGLTALYAFAPEVARQKFEEAASADPLCAMPHWGIALSYGPNVNESYETSNQHKAQAAAAKAKHLEDSAAPADRALIAAAVARYHYTGSGDGDRAARAYFDAMRGVANAYPDDPGVLALAAESALELHPWNWYDNAGHPAAGMLDARRWLAAALTIDPLHLGALHFTIHATELSPQPGDGLAAAQKLASLDVPPYGEHLAHMPAHTFMRAGLYHEAGEANARALSLDADAAGYRNHDAIFGVDAYMMSGERARAQTLAGDFSDAGSRERAQARIVVRFNRCAQTSAASLASPFARGVCAARAGDAKAAEHELADLRSAGGDVDAIATLIVRSEIARARQDLKTRITLLRQAVDIQDQLGYSEPPQWFYPVRESLGAALLEGSDAKDAAAVFERDLRINPRNPRSIFGLAQAQSRLGDAVSAKANQQAFAQAWQYADAPLMLGDL